MGDERRSCRDGPVEDDGGASLRCAQEDAHHCREVGSADGGEEVDRRAFELLATAHRIAHRGALAHPRCIVDARTASDDRDDVGGCEQADDGGGSSGVADPHVPDDEEIGARIDLSIDEGYADVECALSLLAGHRVLAVDGAAGAADPLRSNLRVDVVEVVRFRVDGDVDDADADADLACERIGGGSLGEECAHHLCGDFGRVRRRASRTRDAVVSGEDEQDRALRRRGRAGPAHGRPPRAEVLEPTEGALRLRQGVPALLRGSRDCAVG